MPRNHREGTISGWFGAGVCVWANIENGLVGDGELGVVSVLVGVEGFFACDSATAAKERLILARRFHVGSDIPSQVAATRVVYLVCACRGTCRTPRRCNRRRQRILIFHVRLLEAASDFTWSDGLALYLLSFSCTCGVAFSMTTSKVMLDVWFLTVVSKFADPTPSLVVSLQAPARASPLANTVVKRTMVASRVPLNPRGSS